MLAAASRSQNVRPDLIEGCHAITCIEQLLWGHQIARTRLEIAEAVLSGDDSESFNLLCLKRSLEKLNVESVAARSEPNIEEYRRFLPIIAHLKSPELGESLTVIDSDSSSEFRYLHPEGRWLVAESNEINRIWTGVTLVAGRAASRSIDLLRRYQEREAEAIASFERSMNVVEEFLTASECQTLIQMAEGRFRRSKTGMPGGDVVSRGRTSESAVFEWSAGSAMQKLKKKASHLLDDWPPEALEPIQCVSYRSGQEFRPHFDAYADMNDKVRQRRWTVLVYLNDDFEGGETLFPLLGVRVVPRTGSALVFDNLRGDMSPNPLSLHAGCPVRSGRKFACNIWANV